MTAHIKAHEHDLSFTDGGNVVCIDLDCDFELCQSSIITVLKDVCRIDRPATILRYVADDGTDAQLCDVCEAAPRYDGPLCAGCLTTREVSE